MTINVYIKFGEYYENLKIETPKQTNLTFYEYECEGKHISEALDIERDDWSSIYWVVNALRCYYPYLPYHFRVNGEKCIACFDGKIRPVEVGGINSELLRDMEPKKDVTVIINFSWLMVSHLSSQIRLLRRKMS